MKIRLGELKRLILSEAPGRLQRPPGQAKHLGHATKEFLDLVPGVGQYIGSGNEGDIFSYGSNKVIKVVPEWVTGDGTVPWFIEKQMTRPNPDVVRVFDAGNVVFEDDSGAYWYIMERLNPLSNEERSFLDLLCRDKPAPNAPDELLQFVAKAHRLGYTDVSDENIMRDDSGKLKLIDLEGF